MSELLEAVRQATRVIESLKHQRHEKHLAPSRKKLKWLMMKRWAAQERAVLKVLGPWMRKQAISEADAELQAKLQAAVTGKLEAAAIFEGSTTIADSVLYDIAVEDAMRGAIRNIVADIGIKIAKEQGQKFIADYLGEHAFAKLAKDIDATTKDLIRDGLAREFSEGGTYQDGVRAIEDILGDTQRADVIARTELADAYNQAILQSGREVPGARKQWNTDGPDPCEECIANEDQGEIDIDQDFQSGDDAPPQHPRCLCSISIVMPKEE